tara:strand:- start:196 stop:708 length:513 start_codon:yes stop_codon:yes gene_type:complete
MDDNVKYISGSRVEPQKYNIILTRDGDEIDFEFPPATSDLISRFGFIMPSDERCDPGVVVEEEEMYKALEPVLGNNYRGDLAYHTIKQVIIALHGTAILGYQRQSIIDPRISNGVATFWEIYLDQRIFPQSMEEDWQQLMGEIIMAETDDDDADRKLAEDIKDRLLEQVL